MTKGQTRRGGTAKRNQKKKRKSKPEPTPDPKIREILREAAALVAGGMLQGDAAEKLGMEAWALSKLCVRYRKTFNAELLAAGANGTDRRARTVDRVRPRIRRAMAMRVGGATNAEIIQTMHLRPRTVEVWRRLYPVICREEYERAVEVARVLFGTDARSESDSDQRVFLFYKQPNQHSPKQPENQEASKAELSVGMTLMDFFTAYVWPDCLAPKGDSERTRKDYQTSLRYWRQLTNDPPLREISKRDCTEFLRRLTTVPAAGNGVRLSVNTIHKHYVNIQRLIDFAGASSRQRPDGADLLKKPPWVSGPTRRKPAPKPGFRLEEIYRWLEALPRVAVRCPKNADFDPAEWWRAVILVAYNTGARPGTLFQIRWEWIDGHVLRIPPEGIKGRYGRLLWLNDPALQAVESLRKDKGPVFGWETWPEAENTFRKHRRRQQKAVGIRHLPFYAFRRTFATECGKISPLAMQIMLGHEGMGLRMAIEHYICVEEILADALKQLPQPRPPIEKWQQQHMSFLQH